MRGFNSPQFVQGSSGDLAGLHGCLAVFGQVIAGSDVVVDAVEDFGESRAEQEVGERPVGEEVNVRFVGD